MGTAGGTVTEPSGDPPPRGHTRLERALWDAGVWCRVAMRPRTVLQSWRQESRADPRETAACALLGTCFVQVMAGGSADSPTSQGHFRPPHPETLGPLVTLPSRVFGFQVALLRGTAFRAAGPG